MTMPITDPKKINEVLTRRVEKILPSKKALEKLLLSGKKIRLYQGFDPSTPDLHIGHLVGLLKLKDFQELGHEVIFLIGDFTGMIGDPTGKLSSRKQLTRKMILANAKTYQEQAGMILDFSRKNPVKLKFNSDWNLKIKFSDVIKLASNITIPQLLERDMFQERLKKGKEIFLHEFLYPLVQGNDSVIMGVDLEIGGSDQLFNMLVGRDLMHKIKRQEKFVLTTPLLVDSSGKKIGKTEGNAINIANSANQFFGQIMSLPDEAILPCFKLITNVPLDEVKKIEQALKTKASPMQFKKQLAFELTKMLNGEQKAQKAQRYFENTVQQKQTPENIPLVKLNKSKTTLLKICQQAKIGESKTQIKRIIEQGGVKWNDQKITNPNQLIKPRSGEVLKFGKRIFRKIKIN